MKTVTANEHGVQNGMVTNSGGFRSYQQIPVAGTLKALYARSSTVPGFGKSRIWAGYKNLIAQGLTATITGAGVDTASDLVNSFAVSPADEVYLLISSSGTPASSYLQWSLLFDSGDPSVGICMGGGRAVYNAINYDHPMSAQRIDDTNTAENRAYQVMPCKGAFSKMYVIMLNGPNKLGASFHFHLRNGGSSSPLFAIVQDLGTTGSDLVNHADVNAGDIINMMVEPNGSPAGGNYCGWGMRFDSDVAGLFPVLGGSGASLNTGAAQWHAIAPLVWNMAYAAATDTMLQLLSPCVLKNLYVAVTAAPGVGKKWTFEVAVNGAPTTLKAEIAGAATSANNTATELTINAFDLVSLKITPSGTPAAAYATWGVCTQVEVAGGCWGLHQGAKYEMVS